MIFLTLTLVLAVEIMMIMVMKARDITRRWYNGDNNSIRNKTAACLTMSSTAALLKSI